MPRSEVKNASKSTDYKKGFQGAKLMKILWWLDLFIVLFVIQNIKFPKNVSQWSNQRRMFEKFQCYLSMIIKYTVDNSLVKYFDSRTFSKYFLLALKSAPCSFKNVVFSGYLQVLLEMNFLFPICAGILSCRHLSFKHRSRLYWHLG
jgi:hypothetical protein